MWGTLEHDGTLKITWKYSVDIVGWPDHIVFQNPHNMRTRDCEEILRGVRAGKIYFRRLDSAAVRELALEAGESVSTQRGCAGRVDRAQRWRPRRSETRSKRKIKREIKSPPYILSDD